ncbi:MAG: putative O-methyltransferase [Bryobacterales bacterium]|nr:putative O-methyltransferase [Bryobacterales bacterium]
MMAKNINCGTLYLRLLKRCLTRDLFPDGAIDHSLTQTVPYNADCRKVGKDWPLSAETMIGLRRLDNVQDCITSVVQDGVAGDLVETGVWRGGCAIFMRGVLEALGSEDRVVWLADSFQGLPAPDPENFPADRDDRHVDLSPYLAVSLEQVRDNFRRYELLDDRVRFLPGWFRDTLPHAPIEQISVLRLDGDMYESTYVALTSLYPKLSPGGYVIIDDYNALPNCRAAVDDFRTSMGISDPLLEIDWTGVYWRRYS